MTETRMIRGKSVATVAKKNLDEKIREIRQPKGTDVEVVKMVDELAELKSFLAQAAREFAEVTSAANTRSVDLQVQLLAKARELGSKTLEGTKATVIFKPTTSGTIDPKTLLNWLKKSGQVSQFLSFVKVSMGVVEGVFGKKTLLAEKVRIEKTEEFGRLEILPKK